MILYETPKIMLKVLTAYKLCKNFNQFLLGYYEQNFETYLLLRFLALIFHTMSTLRIGTAKNGNTRTNAITAALVRVVNRVLTVSVGPKHLELCMPLRCV